MFGAALIPLSQAVLLDIYPPEQHGQAMSIWGMGAILGPILGPALGRLADRQPDLALGVLHQPADRHPGLHRGVSVHPEQRNADKRPFDFFGYMTLAVAIGAAQLFLDRGATQDWLSSLEVRRRG